MRRDAVVLGVLAGLALAPVVGAARERTSALAASAPARAATERATTAPDDDSGAATASANATPAPPDTPDGDDTPATGTPPATGGSDIAVPRFTHRSARLADVTRRPVRLHIDRLDVAAPIAGVGVDSAGELDVPTDAATVAWYAPGTAPGGPGSAVLAAHVDYDGRPGVFYDLDDLDRGDVVRVEMDDGTEVAFTVSGTTRYPRDALPVDEVFTGDGSPQLTLVTCGGDFDRAAGHYSHNTVVSATPIR